MKKLIPTEQTEANIAQVIALLQAMPDKLAQLSQPLTLEQLNQPLAPGERSFTQDLAHLLHCEARTSETIYLALLLDEPLVPDIHPERQFGKLWRYELLPFADLLAYFKLRRTMLLSILAGLTEAQWGRTIREAGKKRQESVYWRARGQALHELEHLTDIERKLSQLGLG